MVLADVARDAGTSESTASRALKDDPRIGETTRAAVRASAATLGYVPNAAARSLRARRTHILGLLLDDLADPVHGQMASGFEEAAAGQGYAVFMMTGLHDLAREQRALRAFIEHRADGIVLASCVTDPAEVYARMPRSRVVFVQPDYPGLADGEGLERGELRSDDAAGVTAMIRHLVDRDYRRIAYVGAGGGASDLLRRSTAAATLDELVGEPLHTYDAGLAGWRDPSGVADAIAGDRPDAVMCYDDKLALALMDTLRLTTVDVPADLAVVGFDGIAQSSRSRPRLTTVAVPSAELGRRAVGMLVAALRDGSASPSEVMPVRLVIGETAPQRDAATSRRQSAEPVGGAARGRA
ncbi:MAG: LacI family DNA-binding transcriptional regulator [Candidatus Limnocylindrales bacterium]